MAVMDQVLSLLRIAPLLCSASFITLSYSEDIFLRPLPNLGCDARLVPAYRDRWYPRTLTLTLVVYPLCIITALANLFAGERALAFGVNESEPMAARFYLAGATLAALHFAFGLRDRMYRRRMDVTGKEKEDDEGAVFGRQGDEAVRAWVGLNRKRLLFADFPAFLCFFVGFLFV